MTAKQLNERSDEKTRTREPMTPEAIIEALRLAELGDYVRIADICDRMLVDKPFRR